MERHFDLASFVINWKEEAALSALQLNTLTLLSLCWIVLFDPNHFLLMLHWNCLHFSLTAKWIIDRFILRLSPRLQIFDFISFPSFDFKNCYYMARWIVLHALVNFTYFNFISPKGVNFHFPCFGFLNFELPLHCMVLTQLCKSLSMAATVSLDVLSQECSLVCLLFVSVASWC